MNVLVLNAGSSSQKSCLYALDPAAGALPTAPPRPVWAQESNISDPSDRAAGVRAMLQSLWKGAEAPLKGPGEVAAVGHRVVHGGERFRESVRITAAVKAAISDLCDLAPAHNPAALEGISVVEGLLGPDLPQFAVFDTAFHRDLPDAVAVYPGPYAWVGRGIRRYGFHGINHGYVAQRVAGLIGRDLDSLRIISCHLGNGCSLAAIAGGKSIDTTMGFTPLEGLMMGSRSGTVDPSILTYLIRHDSSTVEDIDRILNKESGLKGISGLSADMRDTLAARAEGNPRAILAFDIYVHRICAGIGAMLPGLGGLDALVFTAGVGEHSADVRAAVCERLGFLGVRLDGAANRTGAADTKISPAESEAGVWVIRAEEDWAIAKECVRLLESYF